MARVPYTEDEIVARSSEDEILKPSHWSVKAGHMRASFDSKDFALPFESSQDEIVARNSEDNLDEGRAASLNAAGLVSPTTTDGRSVQTGENCRAAVRRKMQTSSQSSDDLKYHLRHLSSEESPAGSYYHISQDTQLQVPNRCVLEHRLASENTMLAEQLRCIVEYEMQQHQKRMLCIVDSEFLHTYREPPGESHPNGSPQTPTQRLLVPMQVNHVRRHPTSPSLASLDSSATQRTERQYKSKLIASLSSEAFRGPPTKQYSLSQLVGSIYFDTISCLAILLNISMMALEVQSSGANVGCLINHPDCDGGSAPHVARSWTDDTFTVMAVLFSSFFAIELLCRIAHLRFQAVRSGWIWFDALVLVLGGVETMSQVGSFLALGVNPTALRAARIFRMLRMLRVLRLLRSRESFHTLFLLLKSILASRHALVWSFMILYFTMTCAGLLINQLLHPYLLDQAVDQSDRQLVFEYFGTYTRMLVTMYEITLGNWAPPSRILMEKVSQWWGLFIVLYRCVFCFALVNVTGAVFITESSRVAADDEVQMLRKARTEKKMEHTLREVFLEIDTSCDGYVTLDELRSAIEDNVVKRVLEVLDLQIRDIEELFALMDNGTGRVPQKEFIQHILHFRGPAQSIKQVAMMNILKKLDTKIEDLSARVTVMFEGGLT